MGPDRTSTVHGCPSRWEGCGWPETTTTTNKFTAHSTKIGQLFITNESAVDGNSSALSSKEYSGPRNFSKFNIQEIINDHVKIGPVTDIEVFESAETLVLEVQVPSSQRGNSQSWARRSGGVEHYARQFVPPESEPQHSGAASSPKTLSCGRPGAQTTGGHSPARYKAAPQPKLISIGFIQPVWKINPSKSKTQKDV